MRRPLSVAAMSGGGGFFVLPDRSDSGKTTRDIAFCCFVGSDAASGNRSMRGVLHADCLCDEEKLGFEGRRIHRCKFTFTPELSTRPLLNAVYKRMPTNATQKLRKPHIDLVPDGSFGRCVHFLETNSTPKFSQNDDDLASITKRAVRIVFSKKRTFKRNAADVDEASGIYLMLPANAIRETVLKPSTRRGCFRYWANFDREFPLDAREELLGDMGEIDSMSGSTLQQDTDQLFADMLHRPGQDSYASTESYPVYSE